MAELIHIESAWHARRNALQKRRILSRELPIVLQGCSVALKIWITRTCFAGQEIADAVRAGQRFARQGIRDDDWLLAWR